MCDRPRTRRRPPGRIRGPDRPETEDTLTASAHLERGYEERLRGPDPSNRCQVRPANEFRMPHIEGVSGIHPGEDDHPDGFI